MYIKKGLEAAKSQVAKIKSVQPTEKKVYFSEIEWLKLASG
jgi:hypothetical protein